MKPTNTTHSEAALKAIAALKARVNAIKNGASMVEDSCDTMDRAVDMMLFHAKIVGVTYDNPDGTNRQHIISRLTKNSQIRLERDYGNFYDPNAIMVTNESGEQIGFLPREIASQMAPRMDMGHQYQARISDLTGGGSYTSGVNIEIHG